jgi:hypothetical protein
MCGVDPGGAWRGVSSGPQTHPTGRLPGRGSIKSGPAVSSGSGSVGEMPSFWGAMPGVGNVNVVSSP